MTRSHSEGLSGLPDESCALVWDELAQRLELQHWTDHKMNLIDDVVSALREARKDRLRQQTVVSLADWRKACEGV